MGSCTLTGTFWRSYPCILENAQSTSHGSLPNTKLQEKCQPDRKQTICFYIKLVLFSTLLLTKSCSWAKTIFRTKSRLNNNRGSVSYSFLLPLTRLVRPHFFHSSSPFLRFLSSLSLQKFRGMCVKFPSSFIHTMQHYNTGECKSRDSNPKSPSEFHNWSGLNPRLCLIQLLNHNITHMLALVTGGEDAKELYWMPSCFAVLASCSSFASQTITKEMKFQVNHVFSDVFYYW